MAGSVGIGHQDERHRADLGHAGEIVDRIEIEVAVERAQDGEPVGEQHQRVAVGRALGGAGDAGHAGAVLDDHLLAPDLGELFADGACEDVGNAAGRDRDDDADLLTWETSAPARARRQQSSSARRMRRHRPPDLSSGTYASAVACYRDRGGSLSAAQRNNPVASISARIARFSCSVICNSGVRTGPAAMPSISDHALIAAIGSTCVSCQRPCSQRCATWRTGLSVSEIACASAKRPDKRELGVLAHRLPGGGLHEIRRGRGLVHPLAMLAHHHQEIGLRRRREHDPVAAQPLHREIMRQRPRDLGAADVLDGGDARRGLGRDRRPAGIGRVEQPDADIDARRPRTRTSRRPWPRRCADRTASS